MYSAIPLKLQISFWLDEAWGLFLAFLGNSGCIYSVLQDDIFRCSLSYNPATALCCQYVCLTRPWGKACGCHLFKNAVAEPGHPSLLIYRAGCAVTSLTGALPGGRTYYTRTSQEIIDLEQPWVCVFNQIKASLTPQPSVKCCSRLYETLCAYLALMHTVLWLSEAVPSEYCLTHTLMVPSGINGVAGITTGVQAKTTPWLTFIK